MVAIPKVLNHRTWTLGVAEEWEKGVAMEELPEKCQDLLTDGQDRSTKEREEPRRRASFQPGHHGAGQ